MRRRAQRRTALPPIVGYKARVRRQGKDLVADAELELAPGLVVRADVRVNRAQLLKVLKRQRLEGIPAQAIVGAPAIPPLPNAPAWYWQLTPAQRKTTSKWVLAEGAKRDLWFLTPAQQAELRAQYAQTMARLQSQSFNPYRDDRGALASIERTAKDVLESDVLRKVANTVSDPRFTAVMSLVPGVGPAAAAGMAQAGAAWNGMRAAVAEGQGANAVARLISSNSAGLAKSLGVPPEAFNVAQAYGADLVRGNPQLATMVQQYLPQIRQNFQTLAPTERQAVMQVLTPQQRLQANPSGAARLLAHWLKTNPTQEAFGLPWAPSKPVADFQRATGLTINGHVDAATRQRAAQLGAPLPDRPAAQFSSPQQRAAAILVLGLNQNRDKPEAFGYPGRPSAGVAQTQTALGLPATGIVDAQLRAAVRSVTGRELPPSPIPPVQTPVQAAYPYYGQPSYYYAQPTQPSYYAPAGGAMPYYYPHPQAASAWGQWNPAVQARYA